METFGPKTEFGKSIHSSKYRGKFESFYEYACRVAGALTYTVHDFQALKEILLYQYFLPGGRIQSSVGSPKETTAFNCYVAPTIPDSSEGIMEVGNYAFQTMRRGGGIGYDFSTLRPKGENIRSLDSPSSGPVAFMDIFDAICGTVSSAGNRRGAQLAALRVDHPDIEEFIRVKQNNYKLTRFNISVGITDEFMRAVQTDGMFDLRWNGKVYSTIRARPLWDEIMRSTWDWAEPGVLFLDRINDMNNLWYCENIAATNPCGEQPLPPHGACLLGSFNLVKYVYFNVEVGGYVFDTNLFIQHIKHVVKAMDNVIDNTIYPRPEQEQEAKTKRRMGLGVTGIANVGELLGFKYGSEEYLKFQDTVLSTLTYNAYDASVEVAKVKGPFPMFDKDQYLKSLFVQTLPKEIQERIARYGIRNSHLTSLAPTGTISIAADNVSGGIEPPFNLEYDRTVNTADGQVVERVQDYGYRVWGVKGKVASECTLDEHVNVLIRAQKYIDSAVSKTCNVGSNVTFQEFRDIYMKAWEGGAKGCTTFREDGKRFGILKSVPQEAACYIDPTTGVKDCGG